MSAIDFGGEDLITLTEATKVLPNRPCLATLHRWTRKGVSGHRLECFRFGGRIYTSKEALARFVAELSKPPQAAENSVTPASRKSELGRVAAELQAAGI